MDEQHRRDDVIERELSRALRAAGPDGAHVDAEAAAAWIEHRLDAASSRSIDAHLSTCVDCQTIVATLARLGPEPEPAAAGWWSRLRLPWLVPVAAAATALAIWVSQPREPVPQLESTQARAEAPAAPEATEPANLERRLALEDQPAAAPPAVTGAASAREGPPPALAAPKVAAVEPEEKRVDGLAAADSLRLGAIDTARAPEELARAAADAAAPPPGAETSALRKSSAAVTPAAPPVAERQERAGNRTAATFADAATLREAVGDLAITAADGRSRWRRRDLVFEFAPGPDAPFALATLPLDGAAIAAGSSPGGTVCWLAGRQGTVLVTSDGVRFARVTPPAALDFIAVAATDARTAVVTAAGGRRFRTTDQGATWAAIP